MPELKIYNITRKNSFTPKKRVLKKSLSTHRQSHCTSLMQVGSKE